MGHADEDTARQKEEELIRAQVELEERRLVQGLSLSLSLSLAHSRSLAASL